MQPERPHKSKLAIVEIRCKDGGKENENTGQPPLIIEKKSWEKWFEYDFYRFLTNKSEESAFRARFSSITFYGSFQQLSRLFYILMNLREEIVCRTTNCKQVLTGQLRHGGDVYRCDKAGKKLRNFRCTAPVILDSTPVVVCRKLQRQTQRNWHVNMPLITQNTFLNFPVSCLWKWAGSIMCLRRLLQGHFEDS